MYVLCAPMHSLVVLIRNSKTILTRPLLLAPLLELECFQKLVLERL